jgi:hypothetical protein
MMKQEIRLHALTSTTLMLLLLLSCAPSQVVMCNKSYANSNDIFILLLLFSIMAIFQNRPVLILYLHITTESQIGLHFHLQINFALASVLSLTTNTILPSLSAYHYLFYPSKTSAFQPKWLLCSPPAPQSSFGALGLVCTLDILRTSNETPYFLNALLMKWLRRVVRAPHDCVVI